MSQQARKLLAKIATSNSITKTEVVEYCVARYAAELGIDIKGAKALLFVHLTNTISKTGAKK